MSAEPCLSGVSPDGATGGKLLATTVQTLPLDGLLSDERDSVADEPTVEGASKQLDSSVIFPKRTARGAVEQCVKACFPVFNNVLLSQNTADITCELRPFALK